MATITEIAPDVFRISTFVTAFNLQFNQFLVRDEEPLLFHTGLKALFPAVREAVATLIDPSLIRWIGFSHLEADECGSLREWQTIAPHATAVCSLVGKLVSIDDCMAVRPAKGMLDGEVLTTGRFRFLFLSTPHVPHCWEAGMFFEEAQRVLFCSDLFHQNGDVEPMTDSDVIGRCREALAEGQRGPLANYMPYSNQTNGILHRLAALEARTLAAMHGTAYTGDGKKAMQGLALAFKEILG